MDADYPRRWVIIARRFTKVILPQTGTPQGGVISAVLANIYLHYVLDLWFEKIVKPGCKGDAMLMRFADDYVCCFQYYRDLSKLREVMGERLGKFKLELSETKTRVIEFTRFETRKPVGTEQERQTPGENADGATEVQAGPQGNHRVAQERSL